MRRVTRAFVLIALVLGSLAPFSAGAKASESTESSHGPYCIQMDRRQYPPSMFYDVIAWGCDFYGHYHFYGPGLDVNTPDRVWTGNEATAWYQGYGSGDVHIDVWEWTANGWNRLSWGIIRVPWPPCCSPAAPKVLASSAGRLS